MFEDLSLEQLNRELTTEYWKDCQANLDDAITYLEECRRNLDKALNYLEELKNDDVL